MFPAAAPIYNLCLTGIPKYGIPAEIVLVVSNKPEAFACNGRKTTD